MNTPPRLARRTSASNLRGRPTPWATAPLTSGHPIGNRKGSRLCVPIRSNARDSAETSVGSASRSLLPTPLDTSSPTYRRPRVLGVGRDHSDSVGKFTTSAVASGEAPPGGRGSNFLDRATSCRHPEATSSSRTATADRTPIPPRAGRAGSSSSARTLNTSPSWVARRRAGRVPDRPRPGLESESPQPSTVRGQLHSP